jgi:hypothetical protein
MLHVFPEDAEAWADEYFHLLTLPIGRNRMEDLRELMSHLMALNEYAPPNMGPRTMHELRAVLKEIDASMLRRHMVLHISEESNKNEDRKKSGRRKHLDRPKDFKQKAFSVEQESDCDWNLGEELEVYGCSNEGDAPSRSQIDLDIEISGSASCYAITVLNQENANIPHLQLSDLTSEDQKYLADEAVSVAMAQVATSTRRGRRVRFTGPADQQDPEADLDEATGLTDVVSPNLKK